MNWLSRVFENSFAITFLWIGFVMAISFVETPLRFQVEGLEQRHILSIGHLVFHALNYAEIGFATLLLIGLMLCRWDRMIVLLAAIAIGILAFQTWMLFGILDERTLARIAGKELPDAPWHSIYIGLEVIKLLALATLAFLQVRFVRNKPESA